MLCTEHYWPGRKFISVSAPSANQKPLHLALTSTLPHYQHTQTQAHMADDPAAAPPPVPPPPPDHAAADENDGALPLLFAESPGEHASLLVSASSHQD